MGNNSVPKFIFRLSRFPVYRGSVLGRFYCTYYFSTATVVARTRLDVMLYVLCLCCFVLIKLGFCNKKCLLYEISNFVHLSAALGQSPATTGLRTASLKYKHTRDRITAHMTSTCVYFLAAHFAMSSLQSMQRTAKTCTLTFNLLHVITTPLM